MSIEKAKACLSALGYADHIIELMETELPADAGTVFNLTADFGPAIHDELRAVEGFSFVVLKQLFLILLDFLSLTRRSAPSCQEDALRLFSLWSRSIPVVLIKMGDLAQIMAQNLSGGYRFFLVQPVLFHASLWHRPGTNRLIPP